MPFESNQYRKETTSLKHMMTFSAHKNTLMQMNIEMHSQDLFTLGRDNAVKVWTVNTQKTKNLASRLP